MWSFETFMKESIDLMRSDVSVGTKLTFMDSHGMHSHKSFVNYCNSLENFKMFLFGPYNSWLDPIEYFFATTKSA